MMGEVGKLPKMIFNNEDEFIYSMGFLSGLEELMYLKLFNRDVNMRQVIVTCYYAPLSLTITNGKGFWLHWRDHCLAFIIMTGVSSS